MERNAEGEEQTEATANTNAGRGKGRSELGVDGRDHAFGFVPWRMSSEVNKAGAGQFPVFGFAVSLFDSPDSSAGGETGGNVERSAGST